MSATPATSLTLVSSGLQDARLQPPRGNPDIHQFINVVRKTTRWAAQWNRVEFDGTPAFGQRVSMTLPLIGELITGFTLVVTMPDIYTIQNAAKQAAGADFLGPTYGWTNNLGHSMIQLIELEIGGIIVEQFDSILLEMLDELYETVESSISKNEMIKRAPNGFGPTTFQGAAAPVTVYVPIPFWWSKPGVYSHALPIQALSSDAVRIHVTFRPISQLFYTDARVDPRTVGFRSNQDISGAMWGLEGGRFWKQNPQAVTQVFSMNASVQETNGELIPNITMPYKLFMTDAYGLIEYISLEEPEAIAFRTAELTYQVEQHIAVPVINTQGSQLIRVNLPYGNPVKELLWVAQRPEAATYNATFLFTQDLAAYTTTNPCLIPWWSDAQPVPSAETGWQVVPAFQQSYSEPIQGATLLYNGIERFVHEGASFFRGLIPALKYVKSAIYNRYVYAYSFGMKEERLLYEVKGAANWDKIKRKELFINLNRGRNLTAPPNLNLYVYITVWNIFKVYGGRGGMLFTS